MVVDTLQNHLHSKDGVSVLNLLLPEASIEYVVRGKSPDYLSIYQLGDLVVNH